MPIDPTHRRVKVLLLNVTEPSNTQPVTHTVTANLTADPVHSPARTLGS
jgi:hypothetical protein